jgi:hypothetical protein
MKATVIFRKCAAANGTALLHPVGIAGSDEVANEMVAHAKGFIDEIQQGKIVVQTPDGPRAVMSVAQLLAEIGIADIGYATMTGECKESNLLVPRNLVTLQ